MDRVLITFMVIAGLGLLWLGWQIYAARVKRALQPVGVTAGKPNLLYFTGEYCAACKFQQTPTIEAISAKFGEAVVVKTVDVSAQPELASRYQVLTLPTTVIVNTAGQIVHINRGVVGQETLELQLL